MITFNNNLGTFTVKFTHTTTGAKNQRTTICEVFKTASDGLVGGRKPSATGVSLCSTEDNFCRQTGREISLSRAIKHLTGDQYAQLRHLSSYLECRGGKGF